MPHLASITRIAARLARAGRAAGHRRALVLAGEAPWARAAAVAALQVFTDPQTLWLGEGEGAPDAAIVLTPAAVKDALGREVDACVVDAFAAWTPDALGALAGTVRAGGLLILLAPPLDVWPERPGPLRGSLAVEGCSDDAIGGRFIARLAALLRADSAVAIVEQGAGGGGERGAGGEGGEDALPASSPPPTEEAGLCRTADQAQAVAAILRAARGRARRPLLMTADRGRGKSAALGLAAARLMREDGLRIVVTAPGADAVAAVFRHAQAGLGAQDMGLSVSAGGGWLRYIPPGPLMAEPMDADLVMVDEAAGLPLPLLDRILGACPRAVFSTTIHGYEGTGRGFALRFAARLRSRFRDTRQVTLAAPVRWAPGDPVEALTAEALLLDAEPAEPGEVDLSDVEVLLEDRAALAADERRLRALFGLLVTGHYRTTPTDLLRLLDAPNVRVLSLCHNDLALAAAVVTVEGGLGADLREAIAAGRRRPRGHLLPASLGYHHGLEGVAALTGVRVVRIAVHPAVQRRGLGVGLMRAIEADARALGADYLGTSFGATAALVAFWRAAGLGPVRVGIRRGRSTGLRSAVMVRGLSEAGAGLLGGEAARLGRDLPLSLADPLSDLEVELAVALLAACDPDPRGPDRDPRDWRSLRACAAGALDPDLCAPALWRLVASAMVGPGAEALPAQTRARLVSRILQRQPWERWTQRWALVGRAEAVAAFAADLARVVAMHDPG